MSGTVQLFFETRGQGLPVVLLHGFPFDHTIWAAQAEALSDSFRIITPDLRGHGQSPIPDESYSLDLMAQDIGALLDDLSIPRAVWVGHSMGGYITMAALRQFPERIAGIGLVATHPHADTDDKRIERIKSAEAALQSGPGDLALSMMGVLFAPSVDRKSDMAQTVYRIMLHTAPAGVAGTLRAMADRPDSVDTLRNVNVPAVVIAGVQDQIVKLDVAQAMAGLIPHAHMIAVDNAGHMPMIEQPDATTLALRRFLETVDAR
jgi:3-oxoadipate enol-lactonase